MRKAKKMTIHRIPITEARRNLGSIAKRTALNGEYFIFEKDGIPIMGIMDPDELEDYLDLRDPEIIAAMKEAREDHLAGRTRPAEDLLAELKAENAKAASKSPKGVKRKKV